MSIRPAPSVEALPQYADLRVEVERLVAELRRLPARHTALTALVATFQLHAGVTGDNDEPSGLYGPMTRQAVEFFLPPTVQAPPAWPGTQPGNWVPPDWARVEERVVVRETVQTRTRTPAWVWWALGTLGTVAVVGIGVGVARSRERTALAPRRPARLTRAVPRAAQPRRNKYFPIPASKIASDFSAYERNLRRAARGY